MKAPLRIALTLFSYEALQSWVILICGVVAGIGILVRQFEMAALFAMFMVMRPAYGGGLTLRIVSSPAVLHLRPHGRRQMLLGSTGAITLVALVWALPVLVFQLAGWRIPDGSSVFDLPTPGTIQFFWGATALLWVGTFITSRLQLMFAFSWIPFAVIVFSIGALHVPPEQLAHALFVAGAAVWASFAFWYLRTPSVVQPAWVTSQSGAQSPLDLSQLLPRLWSGSSTAGEAQTSPPAALCQYLTGMRPTLTPLLTGTVFALVWVMAYQFYDRASGRPPVDYLMFLAIFGVTFSQTLVRRARLVWLRAGLDRAGLFAVAERHALRAALAMFSIPAVILVTMSLVQRPDWTAGILLFAVTQVIADTCFLQAGLTVTRGWNVANVLMFVGLGLLYLVMSIILQPHRGAFVWTYLATIAVFGGLTLVLRRQALRAWQMLDWRLAGPLPAGVGQQRS